MAIKIYIDQGHNPSNPNAGAEGNGLREQDINYEVGILTAQLLAADPNYEVRLSRPTPETSLGTTNAESLAQRVTDANNWGADYFISIHANASTITSASGSEAFVYSSFSPAYGLAQDILQNMSATTGLADRGVFIRPRLMNEHPEYFAQGIYNGIREYFGTPAPAAQ